MLNDPLTIAVPATDGPVKFLEGPPFLLVVEFDEYPDID